MSDTNETETRARQAVKVCQVRSGRVTSTGGDKTIHVVVENQVKHPQYGKYMRRRKTLAVHDPNGLAGLGDVVEITPCRRVSKTKSWRLLRVVRTSAIKASAAAGKG